jgi:CO/xanthine dehydrogenase Mo-binding subunit
VEFFWGLERHMELVAQVIGMDPLEFRKKNLLKPGSTTLTGERINEHTGNPLKCLEAAAKAINYGRLTPEEEDRQARTGRRIGKGIATLHKAPAMPSFTTTAAVIKMNSDGSVVVNIALTEIGQGTATVVAQMAADRLRFPVSRVKVAVERDTDKDPFDWQTVASKGLLLTGNAVIAACDDLLRQAYSDAAQVLRAQTVDLDHDGEKIFIKQRPEESVTFAALSIGYVYPNGNGIGGPLIGLGRYTAQGLTSLDKETGQGLPALDWTYGAHGVIAEVDPETGEYTVIKIASAFDVGKVINPGTMRGQCIGGMIQGLGTAQCESYIYDDQGHLLNPSLTDNKILTAKDLPEEIECIAVETPQLDGPFGARGVGEHPMISVAPALANAIHDATGAELTHMPVRFEDVWRAIHNKLPIDTWTTKAPAV